MSSLTTPNKNNASLSLPFRHGKDPSLQEVASLTFTDSFFNDGTEVKDTTFAEIQDQVWTTPTKNVATLTPQNKTSP